MLRSGVEKTSLSCIENRPSGLGAYARCLKRLLWREGQKACQTSAGPGQGSPQGGCHAVGNARKTRKSTRSAMEASHREHHQWCCARTALCCPRCQDIGTGRCTWWRRWCAKYGPAGEPTPASIYATMCGCCEGLLPVVRRIQESRVPFSTSSRTLRPLSLGGPTIANSQVL